MQVYEVNYTASYTIVIYFCSRYLSVMHAYISYIVTTNTVIISLAMNWPINALIY